MKNRTAAFEHPFDNPLNAGLRFAVELIAWIAGPWAVAEVSLWLAVPAVLILVGLPSLFSTVGDKRQAIVPTPGPLRVVLELALHGVAAVAPWLVWPIWVGIVADVVVVAALIAGVQRTRWLLLGAPRNGDPTSE